MKNSAQKSVVILGLLLVFSFCCVSCSADEPEKKAEAKPIVKPLFLSLRVNDFPAAQVGKGAPVWLIATLKNPNETEPFILTSPEKIQPYVMNRKTKKQVTCQWKSFLNQEITLEPQSYWHGVWILEEELAPGKYVLSFVNAPENVRMEPAFLEILDQSASQKDIQRAQRRVLALSKDYKSWLEAIEKARQDTPSDHALSYERVQALEAVGRPKDAHNALAELIQNVQKKAYADKAKKTGHLPSWYYAELRRLRLAGDFNKNNVAKD